MSPTLVLVLLRVFKGSSMTVLNLMSQKTILFGSTVLAIFTTPLLSKIIKSIGNRRKNVCMPNLVLKTIVSASFFPKSPVIFPKPVFNECFWARTVFSVLLIITFSLY